MVFRSRQKLKLLKRSQLNIESLEHRLVLDSTVVLNELMYHPHTDDAGGEWIELHNQMGVNMDLSGWRLTGGVEYWLPDGTVIDGRGYLVIAADPRALESETGLSDVLGPFQGRLSNGGESVRLRNNNDRIMDEVDFSDDYPWPIAADGSGATLAKSDQNSASGEAANWTHSEQVAGTPGAANFLQADDLLPVTTTLIESNATWRFDDSGTDLGSSWRDPGFDDAGFDSDDARFATSSESEIPRQEALVGYWNFDGNVVDSSGTGNDGTLNGASYSNNIAAAVGAGQSLDFGNNGDHVFIPSDSSLNSNVFTLSMYIYDRGQTSNINRLTSRQSDSFETGIDKVFASNGLSFYSPSSGWNTSPVVPQLETWHHVVYVSTGSTMTIYLDGESVSGPRAFSVSPAGFMHIGNRHNNVEGFNGLIDEVGLWNVALTEAEVESLGGGFGNSALDNGPTTYYFRHEFSFGDDPTQTALSLTSTVDDGAVFYLNGTEVHRQNMPAGPIVHSTEAVAEIATPTATAVSIPATALDNGQNVLAVELHHAPGSDDAVFAASLSATVTPLPPADGEPIEFSEVAAATDSVFWVELTNHGDTTVDLDGYEIGSSDPLASTYTFSAMTLQPGAYLQVTQAQLNIDPAENDRLFLYNASGRVKDGLVVEDRFAAISELYPKRWLVPTTATPGLPNQFNFNNDIVINEIMYHPRGISAIPDTPSTFNTTVLLPMGANGWRYNETADNLGASWQDETHPDDDTDWFTGQGPLGYEASPLPVALNTTLNNPLTNSPRVITYYFETEFEFSGDLSSVDSLGITHMIDDGAIVYLNGTEILRHNMPTGPVTNTTLGSPSVGNAPLQGPDTVSADALVVGTNRISVEVHQQSSNSSDVVMGLEIAAQEALTPFIPGVPFRDSDMEWIELYNRHPSATIDISGWRFEDGIDLEFPAGTTLVPGEYLVLARSAAELAEEYPNIRIVQYDGSLSDQGERLELVDALRNPVDIVHYYDSGRWHGEADGGGSSLELRDPTADNTKAATWAPSNESGASDWRTITYRGTAAASSVGPDSQWREFAMGLLTSGEVLIDDVSVIEDPDGTAIQLIQNGEFDFDIPGSPATQWRLLGTHGSHGQSGVIVDPDDPANNVLRLLATGRQEHMFNHAETTLDGNRSVVNGREYEISYRAKVISGSNQLNTRLYFNRLARTTILDVPQNGGTPGVANSTAAANLGPTYSNFSHSPAVPAAGQAVTVSVKVDDPDGVTNMTLYYGADGSPFSIAAMTEISTGMYQGIIPGHSARGVVQFYVEGTDTMGAVSTYPATGSASRALLQVDDGRAASGPKHNLRIVMLDADSDFLLEETNALSNDRIGATVIYDETTIFYDVGVKLKGSGRGRNVEVRRSFNVGFHPDELFRGVHDTIAVDRSGAGNQYSQKEILVKHIVNHAGGVPGSYDDLIHVITPRNTHTGSAMLQMARYEDIYLDSQFENGSDGNLYEYELIYYPTSTVDGNPESLKRPYPAPDGVQGTSLRSLGDDKEPYRYTLEKKNNRVADEYGRIIEFAKAFGQSGTAFLQATDEIIDVDEWLRAFAVTTLAGIGDSYTTGAQHNLMLYVRSDDNRVMFFPHDMDFSFSAGASSGLSQSGDLNKLLADPGNRHRYLGHVHDIVNTTFNSSYMNSWVTHYDGLLPAESFSSFAGYISTRSNSALSQINSQVSPVDFSVTTPDQTVGESSAVMMGNGWVNVRDIFLQGNAAPLDITWTTPSQWQAVVPVEFGVNTLTFDAFDFQGAIIASDTVTITSTSTTDPLEGLRITEINYHPHDAIASELAVLPTLDDNDFEFVEVANVGTATVDLSGVQFIDGIEYDFDNVSLSAGEQAVIVRDAFAFELRYGDSIRILGEYDGGLSNSSDALAIADRGGSELLSITYDDAGLWDQTADGHGASLELQSAELTSLASNSKYYNWRASTARGGSPGAISSTPNSVVISGILANTDLPETDSIALTNKGASAVDISGWYISDAANALSKFEISAGTVLAAGETIVFDENDFNPSPLSPADHHFALSGTNGDDVFLVVPAGSGGIAAFIDEVHFGPTFTGQHLGLTEHGDARLTPLTRKHLACGTGLALVSDAVIAEIMYLPAPPTVEALAIFPALDANDLEYLTVNLIGTSQDIGGWRIRGGISFDFPEFSTTGMKILSFDPNDPANAARTAAFREHYGLSEFAQLLGGYSGSLSNTGEQLRLEFPDSPPPDDPTAMPFVTVDEVIYDDSAPWPTPVPGDAIVRRSTMFFGSNGGLWSHASTFNIGQNVAGDFNGDSLVNGTDIDLLIDAVNRGSQNAEYVTSGTVPAPDESEVDFYIRDFLNSHFGDANLDGSVDGIDFGIWKDHVFNSCSGWADADFNGDGVTDVSDFNIWNDNKFQMAAAATVPEKARTPGAPIALEIAVPPTFDWPKPESHSETLRYVDNTFAVGLDRGEGLSVNHLTRKLHRDRQAVRRTVDKSNERLVDQAFIDLDLIQDNL